MANGERGDSTSTAPAESKAPLFWAAIGGLLGIIAPPDDAPRLVGAFSMLAGAAVLWISARFWQERAKRAGSGNPYEGDANADRLYVGVAFPAVSLSIGTLLAALLEGLTGSFPNWLPIWGTLLGLAAAVVYEGTLLGASRRSVPPRAFLFSSVTFLFLTFGGLAIFNLL